MDEEHRVIRVPLLITLLAAGQDTHSSFLPVSWAMFFFIVLASFKISVHTATWYLVEGKRSPSTQNRKLECSKDLSKTQLETTFHNQKSYNLIISSIIILCYYLTFYLFVIEVRWPLNIILYVQHTDSTFIYIMTR